MIIGGRTDITGVYWSRMARAAGLAKGDYDLIFGGSTGARYAALQAGSADAAMLNPPINFHAKEAGYVVIAAARDYAADLIFGTLSVNRTWAAAHADTARRLNAVLTKATAWFEDNANHDEAIRLMVAATHLSAARRRGEAYDFFRRTAFFEPAGKVSPVAPAKPHRRAEETGRRAADPHRAERGSCPASRTSNRDLEQRPLLPPLRSREGGPGWCGIPVRRCGTARPTYPPTASRRASSSPP